ncbi:MAG: hypothetical protein ACOYS2_02835 [Patescibacteria group bacterium]
MQNLPIDPENKESIIEFLQKPTIAIAETITGLLASDDKEKKLLASRLMQGVLKGNFFTQFGRELKNLREEGKIKEDYFATNNQRASLLELLKFIDDEIPDEEVFKAMKSIFFKSIAKDATEEDELLGYQLLRICKQLGSGEVMTLKVSYEIFNQKDGRSLPTSSQTSATSWLGDISEALNLPQQAIELFEDKLIDLKLITDRLHSDRSGIRPQNFRLTDLGIKLCEFIISFDENSED